MRGAAKGSVCFRVTAGVTVIVTAAGCATWSASTGSPAVWAGKGKRVRVTLVDSSRVVFHDPAVRKDSLFGRVERSGERSHSGGETVVRRCTVGQGVPLTDVNVVKVSRTDPGKSAGGVALVAVGFVAFVFLSYAVFGDATR